MNWVGTSHRLRGWPAERPRAILGIARLGFWPAPRERLEEKRDLWRSAVNTPLGVVNVRLGCPPPLPWRPEPQPGPTWLRCRARDLRPSGRRSAGGPTPALRG